MTGRWTTARVDGCWLRPADVEGGREARWGHPSGIQVGLHPLPGPRGLLRVYTPYLGHERERMLNYVAVEPVPVGAAERGFSELERSRLDDAPGLRIWSTDDPDDATPGDPSAPSCGHVEVRDGVEHLVVHLGVEPFANGADVRVDLSFRADRPHDVTLAAVARPSSAPLETCVLTATMGNYARLRVLRLAGRSVRARELWPDYDDVHFAEHASFGPGELVREGAEVVVRTEPDEADPVGATYDPSVLEHWRYVGVRAAQEWRVEDPDPALRAQVNGRVVYWAGRAPIPGGVAFENVEVIEPFRSGREVTLRVLPL